MPRAVFTSLALLLACFGAARADEMPAARPTPSDDPAAWVVPAGRYRPVLSEPRWVVPGDGLPPGVRPMPSNNNCGLAFFEGRLFLAWRTGPHHFASTETRVYVVSSTDLGRTFTLEHDLWLGRDIREPILVPIGGRLLLYCFEGGRRATAFEPHRMLRLERLGPGRWTEPVPAGRPGEVPWTIKVRGGRAWKTSYSGGHYEIGPSRVDVHFEVSDDGVRWERVGGRESVYAGGVSEVAFEFDAKGDLWAVTRNEDGDRSGFGSHLVRAPKEDLSAWAFPDRSSPDRYDSPRMLRHGEDLYLIARRDLGGPFDLGFDRLGFTAQKVVNLVAYSLRPKRTTLYWIDRDARRIVPMFDLPSSGDTAFPAIARVDAHTFVIANYTSPLDKERVWIQGQLSPSGTGIYLATIRFERVER